MVERVIPIAELTSSTVAPAITLPPGSITRPEISPAPAWDQIEAQQKQQKVIAKIDLYAILIHISLGKNNLPMLFYIGYK
jgi:hypothetical protein